MKEGKFKSVFLVLLVMASIASFAYLNFNKVDYTTPKLTQPKVEDFRQDRVALPDVHVFEAATKLVRKTLPGS